ncbi:MAG: hypothetical protein DWQ01_08505 [Planctomycetota bacterium]|nr:MAG: hypothetical protein DWQ01_08505 [Planctomycetota bacterium]
MLAPFVISSAFSEDDPFRVCLDLWPDDGSETLSDDEALALWEGFMTEHKGEDGEDRNQQRFILVRTSDRKVLAESDLLAGRT